MTAKKMRRIKRTANKMFAQWWGSVLNSKCYLRSRLVTWDSEAFQSPTTAQTQTCGLVSSQTLCKPYTSPNFTLYFLIVRPIIIPPITPGSTHNVH